VFGQNYLKRPRIENSIHDSIQTHQNIFIIGERRSGKTSTVLNVLMSKLKKSYIHIDLYGIHSEWDIAKKLINAIARYHVANWGIESALKSLTKFRVRIETKSDG